MNKFEKIKGTVNWILVIPIVILIDIFLYFLGIFFTDFRSFYVESKGWNFTYNFLKRIGVIKNE